MRGFTLLEITISVAVLIIISVIVVGALKTFRNSQELERVADDMVNLLREARSRTLSSENELQFGVRFEATRAILFEGATFSEGASGNKVLDISALSEIFDINISGGNIVFEKTTGNAIPSGDISVRLKKDMASKKTIFINSSGLFYVQ